jgi:EAL domain-containing protein (putative c-di-GMP-specific phosphodiesterase class I)
LAARLAGLRDRGASIAIDDTGAGHASLNHLIELKPDYIKLDRKLVSGLDTDHGKLVLVRNMLHLAEDLSAKLVAEGIETEGELLALRGLSVPLGQGYFLGRPNNDARAALDLNPAGLAVTLPRTPTNTAGALN